MDNTAAYWKFAAARLSKIIVVEHVCGTSPQIKNMEGVKRLGNNLSNSSDAMPAVVKPVPQKDGKDVQAVLLSK